jgi:NAD(P)-dependent dehydrogenase (short-subunit alcohol dehydrogenase family)
MKTSHPTVSGGQAPVPQKKQPSAVWDISGKTVLVTGATSGIGLEASVKLARAGARVVMVGRDARKTAACVADVKTRAGRGEVASLLCDFSSQADIRRLAETFRAGHSRLDVLVNNAGTVFAKRTMTADGIEATFAVNHLGSFLLTNLLLDLIVGSAPARIVNVSSIGHYLGTMDFSDLGFEKGYTISAAYKRSKLGNMLFTRELARRLEDRGVTVNALHPGAVATGIWSHAPAWSKPFIWLLSPLLISSEKGGDNLARLVMAPELDGLTGRYFNMKKECRPSSLALDPALAAKLWEVSAKLTGMGRAGA